MKKKRCHSLSLHPPLSAYPHHPIISEPSQQPPVLLATHRAIPPHSFNVSQIISLIEKQRKKWFGVGQKVLAKLLVFERH